MSDNTKTTIEVERKPILSTRARDYPPQERRRMIDINVAVDDTPENRADLAAALRDAADKIEAGDF